MRYVTSDGTEFSAQDAEDLVHQMRESSYSQSTSDAEFMVAMAARVKMTVGSEVRCDTAAEFVEDLVRVGVLKEKPEKKGSD